MFSERSGFVTKSPLQIDDMDYALRISLWNIFHEHFFSPHLRDWYYRNNELYSTVDSFWKNYLKQPIQNKPSHISSLETFFLNFFEKAEWYQVYDVLEFFVGHFPDYAKVEDFSDTLNEILARENSAYRMLDFKFVAISSATEIAEVEKTLAMGDKFKFVAAHMRTAVDLYSDRKNPDYRNSIKESISAVEAACRILLDQQDATLGQALKKLNVHQALKAGFSNLYGYTSDESGIRHALTEESSASADEALYMLVTCSAFVNYLKQKLSE